MISESIRTILTADVDVDTAVSSRIYAHIATINTAFPLIVYNVSSFSPVETKDSPSILDIHDFNVNVYSKTLLEAGDISSKVRLALERYSGTVNSHVIQSIQLLSVQELYESEQNIYRIILSFSLRECKS